MKCVKRWGEIKRLGIAGFVTETGDCCLDLADEISKYWGYIDLASIGKIFSSLYSDSILTRFQFCRWGFSWHHWAYKLYGDWTWDSHGLWNLGDDDNYDCPTVESCLNWERAKYFARVYPEALNGQGIRVLLTFIVVKKCPVQVIKAHMYAFIMNGSLQ